MYNCIGCVSLYADVIRENVILFLILIREKYSNIYAVFISDMESLNVCLTLSESRYNKL